MATLQHMRETIEAAERKEVIQWSHRGENNWRDATGPSWNWSAYDFRPKPPKPLELHANVFPSGYAYGHIEREKAEKMANDTSRYALFREVVPTPEPPVVEKREWRVNRRPDGHVWLNPTNAEAKDHPCAEGALVREVLEGAPCES